MFRSVDMSYLQILLPSAVAEEFADKMARHDIMQFTDLNEDFQPFQRQYTGEIVRIQEIERQVKEMEELLDAYNVARNTEVTGEDLRKELRPSNAPQIMDTIGGEIGGAFKKLREQSAVEMELKMQLAEQEDAIRVLQQIDSFLANESEAQALLQRQAAEAEARDKEMQSGSTGMNAPLLEMADMGAEQKARDINFKYFAGVVTVAQRVSFERQVFLTSRGNSFIQFDDVNITDDNKLPFVVFFLGDELKRSLKRLCQFMNIQICYDSDAARSRDELLQEANGKRNDFYKIHAATATQLERDMAGVSRRLRAWKIRLLQEKAIRVTLNQFRVRGKQNILCAEGWAPTEQQDVIRRILDDCVAGKGLGSSPIIQDANPRGAAHATPPTHFNTNSFTASFQQIVDTYGVPRYKEFNPAVPTIMTFPFLFGVMYGDVFHGSFVLLAGILLCAVPSLAPPDFAKARYVILLMGAFAVYCGLVYNDAMSLMMNGFNKSQWGYGITKATEDAVEQELVVFQGKGVYAFGIDPVWHGLDNQLMYENSLKMKLSVILGVTQMTYGLFLKLANHLDEGDYISIFFEFVPQLIFMLSFFGYMCFLIIYKWTIDWTTSTLPGTPSLITVLIKMILSIGANDKETLRQIQVFPSADTQVLVQEILVMCMAISVPWMLVFKPLLLRSKHNAEMKAREMAGVLDVEPDAELQHGSGDEEKYDGDEVVVVPVQGGGGGGHGHGEEFEFSEIVIHQMIHTIEYVLGTISNTASYLRLWALSLAHAQLSEVFYSQTIGSAMGMLGEPSFGQILGNVASQFVFLLATVGVLLVMDVLECFLHALRLHWVEFQSKFFYADGVPFKPFSYRSFFDED